MSISNREKREGFTFLIRYLQEKLEKLPTDDNVAASPSTSPIQSQPAGAPPFMGRPMMAKFGGRCVVCGGAFQQNAPVIFNGSLKKTAHAACGTDDGGRR
jgi:hypothetical protein